MTTEPPKRPARPPQSITAKLAAEKAARKVDGGSQAEMALFAIGLVGLLFIALALGGRAGACHFGYSLASDRDLLRLAGPLGSIWDEGIDWLVGSAGLRTPGGFYYLLLKPIYALWPSACALYAWQLILAGVGLLLSFAMLRALYGPLAALAGAAALAGSTAFLALSLDLLWTGFLPLFMIGSLYLTMKGAAANTPHEIKWAALLAGLAMMIDPGAWVLFGPMLLSLAFVPGWRRLRPWLAAIGLLLIAYLPFVIGLFIPGSHGFSLFGGAPWPERFAGLAFSVQPSLLVPGVLTLLPGVKPALITGQPWFWFVVLLSVPALFAAASGLGLTLLGYRRHRKGERLEERGITGFDPVLAVAGLAIICGLILPMLRLGPVSRLPLIEPGWLMAAIGLAILIAGSIGHLFSPQKLKLPVRILVNVALLLGMLLPATELAAPRAIVAQQVGVDFARVEAAIARLTTGTTDAERAQSAARVMSSLSIAVQGHWSCFDRLPSEWCAEPLHGWTGVKPQRIPVGQVVAPCSLLLMDTSSARDLPRLDGIGLSAILGQSVSPASSVVPSGADTLIYFSPQSGGCPTALDNRALPRATQLQDSKIRSRLLRGTSRSVRLGEDLPYDFAFAIPPGQTCWPGADNREAAGFACTPVIGRLQLGWLQDGQLQATFDARELHAGVWRPAAGPLVTLRAPVLRFTQVLGTRSYDIALSDGYIGYRGGALPLQVLNNGVPSGSYRLQLLGYVVEGMKPGLSGMLPQGKPFAIEIAPSISMVPPL